MDEVTTNSHKKSSLGPLIAFTGVIGIFFVAQVIAINLVASVGLARGVAEADLSNWISENIAIQSLTLLATTAIGLTAVHWLLRWTKTSWQAIGLKKPQLLDVGRALVAYGWYLLFFIISMFILGELIPSLDANQQQQLGFDRQTTGLVALVLTGFSLVLLPAFYEEVLMRGVLFTGLRSKLSFIVTAMLISLLFASAHLELGSGADLNWAAAIDTGILAFVLVYLREKTKSLWPAIFLHGLKNLVAFTLVFVLKVG